MSGDKVADRPWTLGTDFIDGEDEMVCDTQGDTERAGSFLPSHANARHIVKCVNNHERLVEALDSTTTMLQVAGYVDTAKKYRELIAELNTVA